MSTKAMSALSTRSFRKGRWCASTSSSAGAMARRPIPAAPRWSR
jgi:hypothetical protein